jgi:hypothetical protein
MKHLGDQIQLESVVGKNLASGENSVSDAVSKGVARSKQEHTFFGKVSKVMRNAFSPQTTAGGI